MLDYLESPYVLAVGTIVGALLVLLLVSFAANEQSSEEGKKGGQRFVLPCMINPATLDTEDEDEQVPNEDLSKVKGEVNVQNEPKEKEGNGSVSLEEEEEKHKDLDIFEVGQDIKEIDSCITVSPALQAEHKIKKALTAEELNNEREVQQQQLAAIFELMNKQSDKFGDTSLNDIQEQMKMYR